MSGQGEEWLKHAQFDLKAAENLVADRDTVNLAVYHLQQAIEKSLKGYLLDRGWALKKTHDLEQLMTDAMEHLPTLKDHLTFARELTAEYTISRYPPTPSNGHTAS